MKALTFHGKHNIHYESIADPEIITAHGCNCESKSLRYLRIGSPRLS